MCHREQTIERMRKHDTVLAIQDTTALDYSEHPQTKGLGVYSNTEYDLGLLNHTTLAVTVNGVPLGILSRDAWTRDSKELGKRVTKRQPSTSNPPTLQEAVFMIAKLDGFLGRKCDGKPGVKVIWRGLRRLNDITKGWLIAHLPISLQVMCVMYSL